MRTGSFFAISVPGSKKYWSSSSSNVCCVICTLLINETKQRHQKKELKGWESRKHSPRHASCFQAIGNADIFGPNIVLPVDWTMKTQLIMQCFYHLCTYHLQAPITPLIIEPECTPIRISIFRLFRWARTSRISRIIRNPRSTQLRACCGFGSGTPETQ